MSVILATWEAEIGRTAVWGQSGQKVCKTPSQSLAGGMHLSFQATWEAELGRITATGQPGQESLQDPIPVEKAEYGGMCLSSQQWQEA
jgi:hypothetical protein